MKLKKIVPLALAISLMVGCSGKKQSATPSNDEIVTEIKNPVENGILEIDPTKAMKMQDSGYAEVEHVAIFDEAQRSWTHKRLADYLKRGGTYGNKLKVPNFPLYNISPYSQAPTTRMFTFKTSALEFFINTKGVYFLNLYFL